MKTYYSLRPILLRKSQLITIFILFIVSVILISCATTKQDNLVLALGEERQDIYARLARYVEKENGGSISLYEITTPITSIASISGRNAVIVSSNNMPLDLSQALQRYGFYEYILSNVDWIIFCPRLIDSWTKVEVAGMVIRPDIYPGYRTILINTFYDSRLNRISGAALYATTVIHEAAHIELWDNYIDRYIFDSWLQHCFFERFSILREREYINAIRERRDYNLYSSDFFRLRRISIDNRIRIYNTELGLSEDNFELLPEISYTMNFNFDL